VLTTTSSSSASARLEATDSVPIINSCTIKVDTVGTNLQITLTYNGFNTGHSFSRTGTVVITRPLGTPWGNVGCAVTYQYENLAVTKISTGKTFTLNGTRTWTNVSGGRIIDLGHGGSSPVVHQITGSMQVTFENGTTRTWSISRQRSWSGTFPSALTVTVTGFGSAGGYNNLVEYGTNRNGEAFYTQINTAIIYNNTCTYYQWTPIWGVLVHQIPSTPKSATITYGYNSSDALVSEGSCADYYRLDWVIKSKSGTVYLPIP
jgi:hypothetical protein